MQIYEKYKIAHADGTPLKGKKYFVLRLDSDDPEEAARVSAAMRTYERKPRNCDVGTADEQDERFYSTFCLECAKCPLRDTRIGSACQFIWGQMPYNADKDNKEDK